MGGHFINLALTVGQLCGSVDRERAQEPQLSSLTAFDRLQLCRAGLLIRVGACLASIVSGDGVYLAVQSISLAYAFINIHVRSSS